VDRRAGVEDLAERRDVDRERVHPVRVLEPALRDTARHRHLAAFEGEPSAVVAGASLLALDALTRRFAGARAATAAEPLLGPVRAFVRVEVVQRDRHVRFRSAPGNLARKPGLGKLGRNLPGTSARRVIYSSAGSTETRWLTFRIIPRIAGVSFRTT